MSLTYPIRKAVGKMSFLSHWSDMYGYGYYVSFSEGMDIKNPLKSIKIHARQSSARFAKLPCNIQVDPMACFGRYFFPEKSPDVEVGEL